MLPPNYTLGTQEEFEAHLRRVLPRPPPPPEDPEYEDDEGEWLEAAGTQEMRSRPLLERLRERWFAPRRPPPPPPPPAPWFAVRRAIWAALFA